MLLYLDFISLVSVMVVASMMLLTKYAFGKSYARLALFCYIWISLACVCDGSSKYDATLISVQQLTLLV